MNVLLAWALVGLGVAVLAVRQRGLAVGVVTAQTAVLVGMAVHDATDANEFVAAAALAVRTLALAGFFLLLIRRTPDARLVHTRLTPLRRAGLGAALALGLAWLVPVIGLPSQTGERAVLSMVAFGLAVAATRRATLFHILGLVMIENGLVLAALQLPGTSWLIELGLAFDLTLVAMVGGVFHQRIVAEFGAGDTGALRSLHD